MTRCLHLGLRYGALILSLLAWCAPSYAQAPAVRVTGTYSDMYYNKEGGDLLGTELRIVAVRGGNQGVLQFAEGEPEALIVVDVMIDGNKVRFSISEPSDRAGEFTGRIENGVLKGELRYKSGATESLKLPRRKSYWD